MGDKKHKFGFFRGLWSGFVRWWNEDRGVEIMIVSLDLTTNKIECVNWVSEKMKQFCGKFTPELFEKIKPYCRLGDFPNTRIYIWAGMQDKHLAYSEPIENYLNDPSLLKTGQGYDFKSGNRYGVPKKVKCECCGSYSKVVN